MSRSLWANIALLVAAPIAFTLGSLAVHAAEPAAGEVSPATPTVVWTGGPFAASNPAFSCTGTAGALCDRFDLTVTGPLGPFDRVKFTIEPTSVSPNSEDYDLFVYRSDGSLVDDAATSSGFEKLTLTLAPGNYIVRVNPWLVTPGATYRGTVSIVSVAPPATVGTPAPGPSIFATPTLVDPEMHTGEPGIKVSPVIPADGSRPLIVADAPWGTSNATSLWWRSRDGGESFELVQDPLAFPRPRPCEEIDGGGDSDVAFDRHGNIYVSDLAALVNITVGHSADNFQTMACSKAGGTNPIQAVQDRQWSVAAADADGPGPNVDAFLTFRRGLLNTLGVVDTAIQVYVTRDGGATYQPAGDLTQLFGHSRGKVSQTGNPVVDTSNGPRRGTLYQAYYAGTETRVGRYDPATGAFDDLLVSDRPSDPGNVFPSVAIDTAGNLYYAWVEGGAFDTLVSTSTDGGTTWSTPVRVNPPGSSELAVNPYIVAGSPGRAAVLYNATSGDGTPDGAAGRAWHLYVAVSLNALEATPSYTQHQVTDTPLHFNAICTQGLGCSLSGGDRSLLEFNELDIDPVDGSMVFIFADNGRAPLGLPDGDIPQPYIMATRQIAGPSLIAGRTVENTMPRTTFAVDRAGDATYPKAGQAEGPNHPALDLLASRLVKTETGVRVDLKVADLSNLASALAVKVGPLYPVTKALWVTRFEVNDRVFDVGMEHDSLGTRFWYGTPGVARNALGDAKRSDYSSGDGPATTGTVGCDTISIEVPFTYLADQGVDLTETTKFHSVVSFALVDPPEVPEQEVYFNNQRMVDATKAFDWTLGEEAGSLPVAVGDNDPAVGYSGGWHARSASTASGGSYHFRRGGNSVNRSEVRVVFNGSEITYLYGVSSIGGTADLYVDGTLKGSVSYAGTGAGSKGDEPVFGASIKLDGLGAGTHELRIVHRSGTAYVDGFVVLSPVFCAADASAVETRSVTTTRTGTLGAGSPVVMLVPVDASDRELSVLVEGASQALTVNVLSPSGALLATGGALAGGSGASGVDVATSGAGVYTVQVLDPTAAGGAVRISAARTVAVK